MEQQDGVTPSGPGCQPSASAADASSQSGIPNATCPLCESGGTAFMYENFTDCSLCEGEGEVPHGVAAYFARMEAAQVNLYHQAKADREARKRAEEAFDLIAPWVGKFAASVGHYNRTPPRFKGSQFTLEPDPGYNPALAVSVHGQVPLGGPTINDLRFLAEAYASAMSARSDETGTGSVRQDASAVGESRDAKPGAS